MAFNSNDIHFGVLAVLQLIGYVYLTYIKRDTKSASTAVNHVGPDGITLTDRVDVMKDDMEVIKATALVTKNQMNARLTQIDEKNDTIRGMVAELADAHNEINDNLKKVRETVDRRKDLP